MEEILEHPPITRTAALVERLKRPTAYPHPAQRVEVLETHISYVLLAGDFAYKVKKPVRLSFLDFSTLEKRRFYCEEELRLNRRAAPSLYLDVVPVGGEPPAFGSAEEPLEYAVKMRRFPQEGLLDHLAREHRLAPAHVDAFAAAVARMHVSAPRAPDEDAALAIERATRPALDNLLDIGALEPAAAVRASLNALAAWTRDESERLRQRFALRHGDGFVRECHGDLHLGNAVLADGEVVPFDAIEFEPAFRWIDVMSDVAFAAMDLHAHGEGALAARFVNRYLEETGDYGGARMLRFYMVYRAMVRAKVARIRMHQPRISTSQYGEAQSGFFEHVRLALKLARPAPPALVVMHGLSGSGKTVASERLVEALGAVRIRSDVERKRLHGLGAAARTDSPPGGGLYAAETTRRTYAHLAVLAHEVLAAGLPAIVDASFLHRADRMRFQDVARAAGAVFQIASCVAPPEVLERRVAERARAAADASEADAAVLELQRRSAEPLDDEERRHCVTLDTATIAEWSAAADLLARRSREGAPRRGS